MGFCRPCLRAGITARALPTEASQRSRHPRARTGTSERARSGHSPGFRLPVLAGLGELRAPLTLGCAPDALRRRPDGGGEDRSAAAAPGRAKAGSRPTSARAVRARSCRGWRRAGAAGCRSPRRTRGRTRRMPSWRGRSPGERRDTYGPGHLAGRHPPAAWPYMDGHDDRRRPGGGRPAVARSPRPRATRAGPACVWAYGLAGGAGPESGPCTTRWPYARPRLGRDLEPGPQRRGTIARPPDALRGRPRA